MRQELDFNEAPFCSVGKSTVCEGQGLFALKLFLPKSIVVDYSINYKCWKNCLFEEMPEFNQKYMWWVGVNEQECKLANWNSLFMRANHSKTPNTEWNLKTKQLIAIASIFPGEEITYNYQKEIASPSIKLNPPVWI